MNILGGEKRTLKENPLFYRKICTETHSQISNRGKDSQGGERACMKKSQEVHRAASGEYIVSTNTFHIFPAFVPLIPVLFRGRIFRKRFDLRRRTIQHKTQPA